MEKAALFDFNRMLPAIAIECLLLTVALDKLYFTPFGKFMDERDAKIRGELGDVKDASEEVKQLDEHAAAIMKALRAEIAAVLNKMKKESTAELEVKLWTRAAAGAAWRPSSSRRSPTSSPRRRRPSRRWTRRSLRSATRSSRWCSHPREGTKSASRPTATPN